MGVLWAVLGIVAVLVALPWLNSRLGNLVVNRDAERAKAEVQFRAWMQSVAAAQLGLGPEPVEPVLITENLVRSEPGGLGGHCSITWYLRNAEGQYLMLLSTDEDKPFVKLLEDRYAKVVLKKHYRAPKNKDTLHE